MLQPQLYHICTHILGNGTPPLQLHPHMFVLQIYNLFIRNLLIKS